MDPIAGIAVHSAALIDSISPSHFVPNITMGPSIYFGHCQSPTLSVGAPVLASVARGVPGIFMDCHMMVSNPEKVLASR